MPEDVTNVNEVPGGLRDAVTELISTLAQTGRHAAIQRIGREITVGEMGLMMRILPQQARDIIVSNSAQDLRGLLLQIAEGRTLESPNPTADTPEKVAAKFLNT